jgi:hypothetical protein
MAFLLFSYPRGLKIWSNNFDLSAIVIRRDESDVAHVFLLGKEKFAVLKSIYINLEINDKRSRIQDLNFCSFCLFV